MTALNKLIRRHTAIYALAKFCWSQIGSTKRRIRRTARIAKNRITAIAILRKYRHKTTSTQVSAINVEQNVYCTGCSACKNVCPVDAISMNENAEGFLVPKIDKTICVSCGKCNEVCPIVNYKPIPVLSAVRSFAVQASDAIRVKSSSGGVFSVLAKSILRNGGVVCGAVWEGVYISVKHVLVDREDMLDQMRVSKYVQSDLGRCFGEIKDIVECGRKVLFCGTPCQVAGLRRFLGNGYDNLVTMDVVCCGIPSRKVYRKFLEEEVGGAGCKVREVKFRNKDSGWYSRFVKILTSEGELRLRNADCAYEQALFSGLSTNKVCNSCPFDSLNRQGDISIGDFWGIEGYDPKLDDGKGTSLVMVNTIRGQRLIRSLKSEFKLFKRVPIRWAISSNQNLVEPIFSKNRRQFFFDVDKYGLKGAYQRCVSDKADCIVFNNAVTSINYGSMLTAYAIQEVLISMGYYAKILNHARVPVNWTPNSFAYKFAIQYLNLSSPCESYSDFLRLNDKADVFLVGSDQMWRTKYWKKKIDKILLSFLSDNKKRIACAISYGVDAFEGDEYELTMFKRELKKYSLITTREDSGVDVTKNMFGVEAEWILDPVFILDREKWEAVALKSNVVLSDALVYYGWDWSDELERKLNAVAKRENCSRVINITGKNLSVEEWLASIRTSKIVVSNSFHGICFAIIFKKKFVCINDIGQGRFNSLSHLLPIDGCLVNSAAEILMRPVVEPDYGRINACLSFAREHSLAILRDAFLA